MSRVAESVTALWDGCDAAGIARRTRVAQVELLSETESTLDVAHRLAEGGAPAGTLVVADAQRAGRGRLGRAWRSEPGRGVWCTLLERPDDPAAVEVLSLRVGLGIAERLDAVAGTVVRLKWPNDLLVDGGNGTTAKLGGILIEARWSARTPSWVAVGVGVNVRAPRDAQRLAAAGLPAGTRRVDVLAAVVEAVRDAATRRGPLTADEVARYARRDALAGRAIVAPARGRVLGITAAGELAVAGEGGVEHHRTGTIQFAEDS